MVIMNVGRKKINRRNKTIQWENKTKLMHGEKENYRSHQANRTEGKKNSKETSEAEWYYLKPNPAAGINGINI